jgi:hypothetical protein
MPWVTLASSGLGDGRIDNFIIDTSVHLVTGVLVVAAMTVTTVLVGRHALRNEPIGRPASISVAVATAVLAVQALVGIKLLDQGQGILQLYIHYIGGLLPLGVFLAAGWFARGDTARSSRVLAGLIALGWLSAIMAFTIGRAYADSLTA